MRKVLKTLLITVSVIACGIIAVNAISSEQTLGISYPKDFFEYENKLILGARYLSDTVDSRVYGALSLSEGIQSTEELDKMLYTALMNSRFSGSTVGSNVKGNDDGKGKDAGNVVEGDMGNEKSWVSEAGDDSNATVDNSMTSADSSDIKDVPSIQTQTGITPYQDVGNYSNWSTIGYLTISDIGIIREPVVLGFTQTIVDNNSLAMYNDIHNYPGGMHLTRICGHNTGILGKLKRLNIGAEIYLETVYGFNYKYVVTYNDVVYNDEELEPFELSQDLCIFTCVDGMPTSYRRYVRGQFVEGVKLSGLESVPYD